MRAAARSQEFVDFSAHSGFDSLQRHHSDLQLAALERDLAGCLWTHLLGSEEVMFDYRCLTCTSRRQAEGC